MPSSAIGLLWKAERAGEKHEPHESWEGWPRKSTRRRKKVVEQPSREEAKGFNRKELRELREGTGEGSEIGPDSTEANEDNEERQ